MAKPLSGPLLLEAVKSNRTLNKTDLVRLCGFVTELEDGTERLNFTAFYEALLLAKGLDITPQRELGQRGKVASGITTVHFNNNLLVGKAYVKSFGYKPGDQFQIKCRRDGSILLVPLGKTDNDEKDDE